MIKNFTNSATVFRITGVIIARIGGFGKGGMYYGNDKIRIPLYFVRSGLIYPNNSTGTLKLAGANGAWWSSRGSSASANGAVISSAYYLEFTNSAVWSSGGPWERHYGRPLRCLSTVLGMGGKV